HPQLYAAYLALRRAGEAHGLRLFGARAVESMRLEKGFLHWKSDLLTEFDPFETGLARFVTLDKPDFIGKPALETRRTQGPRKRHVTLDIDNSNAPAHPGASVMLNDRVVGTVTSGAWGHRTGKNFAYAFIAPDLALPGTAIEIDIIGRLTPARLIPPSPYDPDMTRPRQ
ncbi:MAG: glycine cleavage T C-terminal barrel domain-containing protein, partial [Roseovarius indicus]